MTHRVKCCRAKARAAVKPVVVAKLIDLYALLVRRLMWHGLCHHRRLGGIRLWDELAVGTQIGCDFEMLLQREFGDGRLRTQDAERRHVGWFFFGERGGEGGGSNAPVRWGRGGQRRYGSEGAPVGAARGRLSRAAMVESALEARRVVATVGQKLNDELDSTNVKWLGGWMDR